MEHIMKIGNIECRRVDYLCAECNKEKLHYITNVEDTKTHYTNCYKCILNDKDFIDDCKMRIAHFRYLR